MYENAVGELIEANKIMASVIDRIFILLLEYVTVEEMEKTDVFPDMEKAARIMSDYEQEV